MYPHGYPHGYPQKPAPIPIGILTPRPSPPVWSSRSRVIRPRLCPHRYPQGYPNRNPHAILTAPILTSWPSPPCALLVVAAATVRAWGTRLPAASVRAWTLQQRGYRAGQLKAAATVRAPRRVIRPRLYPTPRPSPPVLVVALSCHPSPPLSSPESSPSSSPSLVVAARRRVVARSRQMYPQLYPHQYPHKCPHRVLVGACHPSPPLSSPHPPAPVCGDCGGCRAPARLQRGRSDCEGAWTTATVRACGGCSAGFKKAPGCNNSEGAYALQWAWGLQRLRLGVSDCGSEAGGAAGAAAATAAARLGLQ